MVACRIAADDRRQPVIAEVRILPTTERIPRGGVPWTLPRRALTLSAQARFASDMVAGALHIRSRMSDSISRQLVTAMERHGFRVEPPDALRVYGACEEDATVHSPRTADSLDGSGLRPRGSTVRRRYSCRAA